MAPILAETIETFHPTVGVWASMVEQYILSNLISREPLGIKVPLETLNEDDLRKQLDSPSFQGQAILEPATARLQTIEASSMLGSPEGPLCRDSASITASCASSSGNMAEMQRKMASWGKRKLAAQSSHIGPVNPTVESQLSVTTADTGGEQAMVSLYDPVSTFAAVLITSNKRVRLENQDSR